MEKGDKGSTMIGRVWVGECFFWYWPTRVVPDQRPLNGRCCCCCFVCQYQSSDWLWRPPPKWPIFCQVGRWTLLQTSWSGALYFILHAFLHFRHHLFATHEHNIAACSAVIPVLCHLCHHTRLTALFPGLPRWAGTRKVKPIWILLKQEAVSGSGNSWAICKSASRSRQITTPARHHSSFFTGRMPFLPPNQTASKHWSTMSSLKL